MVAVVERGAARRRLRRLSRQFATVGVTVPPETAIVRMFQRGRGSGRYVPTKMLLAAHKGFTQAFAEYAEMADEASSRPFNLGASRGPARPAVATPEKVEERAAQDIHAAVRGQRDPWEKALGGLRAFLEVLQEPRYRPQLWSHSRAAAWTRS